MINSLWISPPRKSVHARQDRLGLLTPVQIKITLVQSSHVWSMIHNVRTMDRTTKRTIVQCTCDQQRLRSVCASTHYIKQASWIARCPKKVHTVQSAKGLIGMCCCSRTVYHALDNPAIEGKYNQRMLLSECAVAQIDPTLRSSHKTFC